MAQIIPKRSLEDIRFANDIADVIGGYITLKKAGSNFKGNCPFHKEKTPSFHVNPQRQIFHCFGCGEGGDVFTFLMKYEGVDFSTAARMLAQRAGVQLAVEEDEGGAGPKKDVLYRIHEEVALFFQRCLKQIKTADKARRYLKERDLPDQTAEKFRIGYAPDGWNSMLQWAEKNKYSREDVEACGLILKSEKSDGKYYDRFRDRLMFPIMDIQGRVIGFSGRRLDSDEKSAKYVNSPETPLFHKSRVLYALDKARRDIVNAEPREAIVCEGQIDVIRCHVAGFTRAVAAQGTAFTEDHAQILHRYADSVVLVFDTDKAGQDAAVKTARLFLNVGMAVRVAALPNGEDPDSFIRKKGAEVFGSVIKGAVSAVAFQVALLAGRENTKSEIGTMRTARAVLETIGYSPSAVQQAKLLQEAAERLNVPVSALQDDMKRMKRPGSDHSRAGGPEAVSADDNAVVRPNEEVALCEHIVHIVDFPEIGRLVQKYLPLNMISDTCCRQAIEAALNTVKNGSTIDEELRRFVDPTGGMQAFSASVLEAPSRVRGVDVSRVDAVKDMILKIWRREKEKERDLLRRSGDAGKERFSKELTLILHRLKKWEDGVDIIELEIEG